MQKSQSGSLCNTILHKIRRGDLKNPESSCICLINHIKTSPEHSSQHFSETYFYNSLRKHFSTTLLHNCSKQLLYKTYVQRSFQHASPTLPCITLMHFSTQLGPQHSSLQNCCSPTLFSINHMCPTLLYNILKHFSTRLFSNTSLHNSSPTLLHNTFLHEFSTFPFCTILFADTSLQRVSTPLFSNTSLQNISNI